MYVCGKVSETTEYERKGNVTKIVINDGDAAFSDIVYNKEKNVIEVVEGNYVVCLSDKIGIYDDVELETIVCNDGIMVILYEGAIYVNVQDSDIIARIDSDGNTSQYIPSAKKPLYWVDKDVLKRISNFKISKMYNTPSQYEFIDPWFNNLRLIFRLANNNDCFYSCCDSISVIDETELPMYKSIEVGNSGFHGLVYKNKNVAVDNYEDEEDEEFDSDVADYLVNALDNIDEDIDYMNNSDTDLM